MSSYRWTEEDLSTFKRNSGRGLPRATLKEMAKGRKAQEAAQAAAQPRIEKPKKPAPPSIGNRLITPAERKAIDEQFVAKQQLEPAKKKKPGKKVPAFVAPPIKHKYHAKAIVVDGIRFDSRLEAHRYGELKLLVATGQVLYFLRQVPFHLPGGIRYVVDFMVVRPANLHDAWDSNVLEIPPLNIEYEDCKGFQDRVSKNKLKQVLHLYGVEVRLVKKAGR